MTTTGVLFALVGLVLSVAGYAQSRRAFGARDPVQGWVMLLGGVAIMVGVFFIVGTELEWF